MIWASKRDKMATKAPQLSIFDQIRNDPKFTTRRSVEWYKTKIALLGGNIPDARSDLLKTTKEKQFNYVFPGTMYMFKYDAKYGDELEYWDMFPCSLIFGMTETGFHGINFHYLPYAIRGKLYDKLYLIAAKYHTNQQQVRRLNWKLLSSVSKFPEVRPAVKQYLYSNVRSRFIRIDVDDWKTAIMLPVDKFAKKSQAYVARDSGQKIRKLI
jgi:hypothetical protein